ncbi:putative reverse transcriptase domain-containing protein [Tanacetum coccineum]
MAHHFNGSDMSGKDKREADNKKRKWENFQGSSSSGGGNNNGNARAMTNAGNQNTNEAGQNVKWVPTGANTQPIVTCYGCGEKGHIKANCPARKQAMRNDRAKSYALSICDQNLGPNVVTIAKSLLDKGFISTRVHHRGELPSNVCKEEGMIREKVIAYASRQLRTHKENYMTHDLNWVPAKENGKTLRMKNGEEGKSWKECKSEIFGNSASKCDKIASATRKFSEWKWEKVTIEIRCLRSFVNDMLYIPLEEVQLDSKLHFIEEPAEIVDREVKRLKQSRIPIIKVRWNSRRGPEFTWEREDFFRSKYPHLFARRRVTRQDKRRDVAS